MAQYLVRSPGDDPLDELADNALGVALLRECDYPAAERVYREELKLHPESGRALFGLRAALLAQKRDREAAAVGKRFERAWRAADMKLETGAM